MRVRCISLFGLARLYGNLRKHRKSTLASSSLFTPDPDEMKLSNIMKNLGRTLILSRDVHKKQTEPWTVLEIY